MEVIQIEVQLLKYQENKEYIMEDFRIKFRGVRGSYPVPNADFLKYGGNTACVEVNVGGHLIILDAGTGLISLGNELMQKYIESGTTITDRTPVKCSILLSHIHLDHIQGFPFFRPSHLASTRMALLGGVNYNETLEEELAKLLFTKSFPLDLGDIAADLRIMDLNETSYIIFKKGEDLPKVVRVNDLKENDFNEEDVVITCYKSYAHPQNGVFIYKIMYKGKTLIYATDKESYPGGDKKLVKFAKGCDLLIHDAQYSTEDYLSIYVPKQGFGHSTFEMALDCKRQVEAKKLVYFHYDPTYNDEKLDLLAEEYSEEDVIMAQEGMEISLL